MTQPISVTEDRVTVTANDTEANIRASAGFAESDAAADGGSGAASPAGDAKSESDERHPDGTFKAKSKADDKLAEAKVDGDPRKSYQAKINQSIAKQREAERRAEAAEQELQSLRQRHPKSPSTMDSATLAIANELAPVPPTTSPYINDVQRYKAMTNAPKLDDFVSDDDPYSAYHAALAVFIADQRMSERDLRDADARAQRARGDAAKTAIDLAEEKHPGFMAAFDAEERQYPAAVLNLLADEAQRDPHFSAELLHHLLTHPDDATHLAAQTHPIAAAREIGRIAAQVSASAGPEPVAPQTTAKPLIKPVRPSIVASESPSTENLPFSKYMQVMNEQERKARTRA